MRCNQICKWNSNVGCVKPYGVPCILENVPPACRKATNADRIRAMSDEELAVWLASIRLDMINILCKKFDMEIEMPVPTVKNTAELREWLQQPAEKKEV